MVLGAVGGGLVGALGLRSAITAIGTPGLSASSRYWSFAKGFAPSGQFGVGYTGGAYIGYGATNTIDPFNIHRPKYKYSRQKIRMAYGMYGYGRYRRRYSRFRRRRYYRRYSSYGYRRRRYY